MSLECAPAERNRPALGSKVFVLLPCEVVSRHIDGTIDVSVMAKDDVRVSLKGNGKGNYVYVPVDEAGDLPRDLLR